MPPSEGGARLAHVASIDSDGPGGREEIESFWETAVESQCEGLMVKVRPFFRVHRMSGRVLLLTLPIQLLDSGEIIEPVDTATATATPLTSAPPSPSKSPSKSRKKPLPATYEPGNSAQ